MARMIRKQIYIDEEQEKILKNKSKRLHKTEAELVREGINFILKGQRIYKDVTAWEREKRFIQSLIQKGPAKGRRRWTREDIYDRKVSNRY
ncbi:MAG: hypothetical protein Q8N09_07375 [Thermodesulfovibrionia bacterium]|nr:hypothetical protein [Thermodesulfovibrionia bacterium]